MAEATSQGAPVLVGPHGSSMLTPVPLTTLGVGRFDEAWLQRLIHDHPSCLPIGEIDAGLEPFSAICREMPTPRGYIDNLLMTGAGDIAIVEAKLFRNPEQRRKVLAQALDYATCLFQMGYEAFEDAALRGTFTANVKPTSLHAALPEADKLSEAAFIDAVSGNLRRGRILILVVGDGIRSEVTRLVEGLQAVARFGFTLALVELGVFQMPEVSSYLIRPRTLAKTAIVQRTIVEVTIDGTTVREERPVVPETLSSNSYWQALEVKVPGARAALETLIASGEPSGVYVEFLKSINFKWARPDHRPVNLGYIFKHASLWTDATAWTTPKELARAYVDDVAREFGCDVHVLPSGMFTLYKHGKPLKLSDALGKLNAWLPAMQRFIGALQRYDAAMAIAAPE